MAIERDLKILVLFERNVKTSEGIKLGLAYRHPVAFIEPLLCTVILPDPEDKQFKKQIQPSASSKIHIH